MAAVKGRITRFPNASAFPLLVLLLATLAAMGDRAFATKRKHRLRRYTFNIAHYNDVHGRVLPADASAVITSACAVNSSNNACFGGYARVATALAAIRASTPTLFFDAGDQFTGTLFSTAYQGAEAYPFQNYLRTSVMTLGNHEFDKGPDVLKQYLQNLTFRVATTNVVPNRTSVLYNVLKPGPRVLRLRVRSTTLKIGVCGWTTTDTNITSSPGPFISFLDPVETVRSCVSRLKKWKVNIVIGLGHAGVGNGTSTRTDLDVIRNVPGLDLVIGGHSHTFIYNTVLGPVLDVASGARDRPDLNPYPIFVPTDYNPSVSVPYVQDFWAGRYLGNVRVTFNSLGQLEYIWGVPILLGGPGSSSPIADDPVLNATAQALYEPLAALSNTIVGQTDVRLNGDRGIVRTQESNLGNLICAAMLSAVTPALVATYGPVNIAITNGGGIRSPIEAGQVTLAQIISVLPFGNVVQIKQLTGQQLINTLTRSADGWTATGFGGFLQVSGLYLALDSSQPAGSRVLQMGVMKPGCVETINPTGTYNLVTNDFTGGGGDGYPDLAAATVLYRTGPVIADVVAGFIQANSPISPATDGRLVVLNATSAPYVAMPTCS